ncbi:hypothetical protein Naga_100293g1 [Nannochloropsis gaditana]|uniref:Uncharacterized protein n=1 Tax=Nannochloropsis gaditana TaxID=72520 RepID=W7T751_9STRA|nr:hypothetical protein Naga_100293g1 [Nannochloropsis gaditana]
MRGIRGDRVSSRCASGWTGRERENRGAWREVTKWNFGEEVGRRTGGRKRGGNGAGGGKERVQRATNCEILSAELVSVVRRLGRRVDKERRGGWGGEDMRSMDAPSDV